MRIKSILYLFAFLSITNFWDAFCMGRAQEMAEFNRLANEVKAQPDIKKFERIRAIDRSKNVPPAFNKNDIAFKIAQNIDEIKRTFSSGRVYKDEVLDVLRSIVSGIIAVDEAQALNIINGLFGAQLKNRVRVPVQDRMEDFGVKRIFDEAELEAAQEAQRVSMERLNEIERLKREHVELGRARDEEKALKELREHNLRLKEEALKNEQQDKERLVKELELKESLIRSLNAKGQEESVRLKKEAEEALGKYLNYINLAGIGAKKMQENIEDLQKKEQELLNKLEDANKKERVLVEEQMKKDGETRELRARIERLEKAKSALAKVGSKGIKENKKLKDKIKEEEKAREQLSGLLKKESLENKGKMEELLEKLSKESELRKNAEKNLEAQESIVNSLFEKLKDENQKYEELERQKNAAQKDSQMADNEREALIKQREEDMKRQAEKKKEIELRFENMKKKHKADREKIIDQYEFEVKMKNIAADGLVEKLEEARKKLEEQEALIKTGNKLSEEDKIKLAALKQNVAEHNTRLQKTLSEKDALLRKLDEQNKKTSAQIWEGLKKIDELGKEKEEQEKRIKELEKELELTKTNMAEEKQFFDRKRKELDLENKEQKRLNEQLSIFKGLIEIVKTDAQKAKAEKDEFIGKLQKDLEQLKAGHDKALREAAEANERIQKTLEEEVVLKEKVIADKEKAIQDKQFIKRMKSKLKKEKLELAKKLEDNKKLLKNHEKLSLEQIDRLSKEIESFRSLNLKNEGEASKLKGDLEAKKKKLADKKAKKKALKAELEKQIKNLEDSVKLLREKNTKEEKENLNIIEQFRASETDKSKLELKEKELREKAKKRKDEIKKLQAKLDNAKRENKGLEEILEQTKGFLGNKFREMNETIKQLREKLRDKISDQKIKSDFKKVESDLLDSLKLIESVEKEALESELEVLKGQHAALDAASKGDKVEFEKQKGELEKKVEKLNESENNLNRLLTEEGKKSRTAMDEVVALRTAEAKSKEEKEKLAKDLQLIKEEKAKFAEKEREFAEEIEKTNEEKRIAKGERDAANNLMIAMISKGKLVETSKKMLETLNQDLKEKIEKLKKRIQPKKETKDVGIGTDESEEAPEEVLSEEWFKPARRDPIYDVDSAKAEVNNFVIAMYKIDFGNKKDVIHNGLDVIKILLSQIKGNAGRYADMAKFLKSLIDDVKSKKIRKITVEEIKKAGFVDLKYNKVAEFLNGIINATYDLAGFKSRFGKEGEI